MQRGDSHKGGSEKQLAKACEYVNDMWFPVNAAQLQKIQNSLSRGEYDNELSALIGDLKSDPALFLYCVREILKCLRERDVLSTPQTQAELFVSAGIETLRGILAVKGEQISTHSLRSCSKLQESRISEMFISAVTTEVLCQASSVDPEIGFTVALFRQLGLALIAWNYPRVYRDAAISASIVGSFDEALSRRLGFSPGTLGVRLCKAWGMPPGMLAAIAQEQEPGVTVCSEERVMGESLSESLVTLCKVGEALARANNPEQYPTARSDWNEARNAIEDKLGLEGMQFIRERLGDYTHIFVESMPEAFRAGLALDPELRLLLRGARNAGELPAIYRNCSPGLTTSLRRLYRSIEGKVPVPQLVVQWKDEVTTSAGFPLGYVFSLEPTLRILLPQLAFGVANLGSATQVHCDNRASILGEAYRSSTPIVREIIDGSGAQAYAIAGIFGFSTRVGVVYVELPLQSYLADPDGHLTHFWALTNSLTDCLSLQ